MHDQRKVCIIAEVSKRKRKLEKEREVERETSE